MNNRHGVYEKHEQQQKKRVDNLVFEHSNADSEENYFIIVNYMFPEAVLVSSNLKKEEVESLAINIQAIYYGLTLSSGGLTAHSLVIIMLYYNLCEIIDANVFYQSTPSKETGLITIDIHRVWENYNKNQSLPFDFKKNPKLSNIHNVVQNIIFEDNRLESLFYNNYDAAQMKLWFLYYSTKIRNSRLNRIGKFKKMSELQFNKIIKPTWLSIGEFRVKVVPEKPFKHQEKATVNHGYLIYKLSFQGIQGGYNVHTNDVPGDYIGVVVPSLKGIEILINILGQNIKVSFSWEDVLIFGDGRVLVIDNQLNSIRL